MTDDLEQALEADRLQEQLNAVEEQLRGARKTMARDWTIMTPRQRSAGSRLVKDLEAQRQALLDSMP